MPAPRNLLITGPTSGIGRAVALALARQGHRLFLLCRNRQLGQALCREISALPSSAPPRLLIADLGDMHQVRAAAQAVLDSGEPLHGLINNAGIVNTSRTLVHIDGTAHEQVFAVNHLGHFLLTTLLLPRLIETGSSADGPARIVVVSSDAYALFCRGLDFDDLARRERYSTFRVYGQSKLANLLMAYELAQRLDPAVVQVNSLHPGGVNSQPGGNNPRRWYTDLVRALLRPLFIAPEQAATTVLLLATGDVDTQGGYYYRMQPRRLKPWAMDGEAARRLWEYSESMVAIGAPSEAGALPA